MYIKCDLQIEVKNIPSPSNLGEVQKHQKI